MLALAGIHLVDFPQRPRGNPSVDYRAIFLLIGMTLYYGAKPQCPAQDADTS